MTQPAPVRLAPATVQAPAHWSRRYHLVLALVVLAALLLQAALLVTGGTDANTGNPVGHLGLGTRVVRLLSYFTIQSNLLVLLSAASLARDPDGDGRLWRVLRLDGLVGVVITGIVFDLVLARLVTLHGAALLADVGLHYLAPWGTLLGWLLFGPRPRVGWGTMAAAFAWPLAWIAWTLLHGALTGWYPYPFLDVAVLGYPAALAGTGVVLGIAVVLAVAFRLLDRLPVVRR